MLVKRSIVHHIIQGILWFVVVYLIVPATRELNTSNDDDARLLTKSLVLGPNLRKICWKQPF